MKLATKDYEGKMQKSISAYQTELESIRVGRANPAVLNKITVDYYGVPTQINQMSEVKVADARTIVISPWDATTLKSIDRAIAASDLGITPANDGKVLRLTFPQLTEERRRELSKQIAKMGEDAKVVIRNIRRDMSDDLKKLEKSENMPEDMVKDNQDKIQKLTDSTLRLVRIAGACYNIAKLHA